ncbi:hypothetical protein D6D12_05813 [Aureobasidium pullulans]|uniref:Transcription initiation factor TFIID subunit 2 n=1 Tax=Aureobasidium pullulans TaxID=5580 RepID=A0AB74JSN3_AURPU|nr:hypothetical protein D6D12_05813 [Aureobasidium pullulans]THX64810.1 hypothetical protein D6D11_00915 [Aureobasidium pullulans]TIA46454.1 hypothetical protein D6C79_05180 [Aureobasidium pullulans]
MPGYFDNALPTEQSLDLGFSVVSQKVDLTVDFAKQVISGSTEITIQPEIKDLKTIRLNCRQARILSANVEGSKAQVNYSDPYQKIKLQGRTTAHQHEYLRNRIEGAIKQSPDPELALTIPSRVTIKELNSESSSTIARDSLKRQESDFPAQAETPTASHAQEPALRYAPLRVVIDFEVTSFRDGLHFVGFSDSDSRYPHLYTRNTLGPGAICSVFPCVDDATTRCMWEISIRCHKTLGDAFRKAPQTSPTETDVEMTGTDQKDKKTRDEYLINLSEEEKSLDLSIVCSGEMTDDIIDPQDPTWRTVSFACFAPVTARHIGFAIGPFEHVDLTDFREVDEDDKLGQNAIKVDGFCLPGRAEELRNTCMPMAKAIDYFTVNYGSFPFSSYKLIFVDDLTQDVTHTASLSICSTRLLFPEDIIEPLDPNTRVLVHALASQWVGVNVIPKEARDMWAITAISGFMRDTFMRKLAGNNEYRYQQKLASEQVFEQDVERYSIHQLGAQLDIDPSEYKFMALKSAVVLFILDRRLTKASGAAGVGRIITRLLLNAKTGDLQNGELSTDWFHRLCEKLGHTKLDAFFKQWVYGAGCPLFKVNQRFNKKKLVVEMNIYQIQRERKIKPELSPTNFMREAKEQVSEVWAPEVSDPFTGPMTIRIHEADGTPYEHIVEIKDTHTKIEIPYNTKYKRLKRSKRAKERAMAANGMDLGGEAENDVLLYCLGDVLQSEDEVKDWRLVDWGKEEEDRMGQESYEWIRMDADFEWIGKIDLIMPIYMYVSQLQQDRDVVAQYESLQHVLKQNAHPLMSTILVRTLMDRRYFHGIRTLAAEGLTKCATPSLNWVGQYHLERAFQEFFCFADSPMPRANDFSDRMGYLLQKAIPIALSHVKDERGKVPMSVRRFFVDKLKFNDNSNNEFSDCYYVSTLMRCLAESLVASAAPQQTFITNPDDDDDLMQENLEDEKFQKEAINELERYRRIDEWISSYQNIYSVTALECMRKLFEHGVVKNKKAEILQYTQSGNADEVRLAAWDSLVRLKLARRPQVLKYLLHCLSDDPSPYFRDQLLQVLGRALGTIALKTHEAEKHAPKPVETGGLVLEQEEPLAVQSVPLHDIGKSPPELALLALKAALVDDEVFKAALWHVIQSPILAIPEVVSFLDIAALIYDASNGLVVHLRLPRYYSATNIGKGKVKFTEKHKYRTVPTAGLGLEEYQMVQQYDLKYTGPLSRDVKDHIKLQKNQAREQVQEEQALKNKIAAMQQEIQQQQQQQQQQLKVQTPGPAPSAPRPSQVSSTAMSPPPLPTPTGSMKLTLKRKQSSTAEPRASSPKRPHLVPPTPNGTAITPKVEKSPSLNLGKIHAQTPSRTVSGASAPGSAAPSRKPTANDKPSKSKVVRLKISKQKRLQRILSQPPQPGARPQKPKVNLPAKINTSSSARPSPAPSASGGSQARGASNGGDFFASPEVTTALSAGASVATFRTWDGLSSIKKEADSAPMSAVSPMTTTYPKSNGSTTATGTMSPRPSEGAEDKKPALKFKLKLGKKPPT